MTIAPPAGSRITSAGVDLRGLLAALGEEVDGEVRFDSGSRAAYSTDASNYRQVPLGVVVPRTVDAGAAAVAVCRRFGVAVTSRGGGTSLAGQACSRGVVIDWSKYCTALVSVDEGARSAIVEPGIVLDELNGLLRDRGLMFGPKPATHSHCTIGGMLGNNSCGSSAQAYGKTVDNVLRLEVLSYDGERLWVGPTDENTLADILEKGGRRAELYAGLAAIADEYGADVREGFPRIPRRVSGYNLDDLLPEKGFDVARALVGSEGTLVTVLRAELRLVEVPRTSSYVVAGFPSVADAADAAPEAGRFSPIVVEGLDSVLIDDEREKGRTDPAVGLLPEGKAWLIVELAGDDRDAATAHARDLVAALERRDPRPATAVIDDPDEQRGIMSVREAGLGASAWVPGHPAMWPGWEDSAVDPERLGDYLRDLTRLFDAFGYHDVGLYGHFGQGCVHCRIPFDLADERGIAEFRRFLDRAAELVVGYGGSLSGEHGDGMGRGALWPIMFGDRLMAAFRRLKHLFDPDNRMNPGKLVDAPDPSDDLRLGAAHTSGTRTTLHFAYPRDEGSFDRAALRCVGVGNCRGHDGAVMCPSYRATGEEEHSTRGRARLLYEMVDGRGPITDGWHSTAVADALDLCLSCKGCKSDCPVEVDMATYKAEFLSHHYAHRLRPMAHYSMGWLPLWARIAHLAPGLVNAATGSPWPAGALKRLGGIEPERPLPVFATTRFTDWFARRPERGPARNGDVLLWPDTFTDNFHPGVGRAAVRVLEDAGYRVRLPGAPVCCALTWISTGQLGIAARVLRRTAAVLSRPEHRGLPVVGLEPSCLAALRSDAPDLLPNDDRIAAVADRTTTLATLLTHTEGWRPPRLKGRAVAQPHCHQHAVLGFDDDEHLLSDAGVTTTTVGGCCGLAGNFGFEPGHLDVSLACAESELLPAVRAADPATVILADGFSCRTQLDQTAGGRRAAHLAELLAAGLDGVAGGELPERRILDRPGAHRRIPEERVAAATPARRKP